MKRRYRMRWRGVECSYTEAEKDLVGAWIAQCETGTIKASEVAQQWDVLQALKLELDATLVDESDVPLFTLVEDSGLDLEMLPPQFIDGTFKLPERVLQTFRDQGKLPPPQLAAG